VKYRNEEIREALAAEYAVGTLQGAARRRFERSLKDDPPLRRLVAEWEARLAPLDAAAAPIAPPRRVWETIQQRIAPRSAHGRLWNSIGFWRRTGLASSMAAAVLAAVLLFAPPREMMVVVMSDDKAHPAMTVSWRSAPVGDKRLRVRVIGHQTMAPDTTWELWMVPGGGGKPVSLGLINTHETQTVVLPPQLQEAINSALGLAMSVEPSGGSPTGLPTGPILYQGPRIQL
jgi:anti-sigma-K factor RskA